MIEKYKPLTLSIIIPAYNEENYIRACLESIAEQTVKPLEVILVDNNSTDATVDIVREFDFVKIIREKRQHQSYAQHTGFANAKGDLVGRIDADSILPPDWTKRYIKVFADNPDIIAFTAGGRAYDTIFTRSGESIFKAYNRLASKLAGNRVMWGANCAFRKNAWNSIKDDLLLRDDIWEDYDLSFCLAKHGKIGAFDNDILVSYRAIHRTPLQMLQYQLRSVRTFNHHRGPLRAGVFSAAWSSLLVIIPFALLDCYVIQAIKNIPAVKLLGESLRG